ncbi:MAG: hypothetical protein ACLVJ6_02000 [Merdibacter sp.]
MDKTLHRVFLWMEGCAVKEKLLELLERNDRGYTSEELAQLLNIQGSAQYTS